MQNNELLYNASVGNAFTSEEMGRIATLGQADPNDIQLTPVVDGQRIRFVSGADQNAQAALFVYKVVNPQGQPTYHGRDVNNPNLNLNNYGGGIQNPALHDLVSYNASLHQDVRAAVGALSTDDVNFWNKALTTGGSSIENWPEENNAQKRAELKGVWRDIRKPIPQASLGVVENQVQGLLGVNQRYQGNDYDIAVYDEECTKLCAECTDPRNRKGPWGYVVLNDPAHPHHFIVRIVKGRVQDPTPQIGNASANKALATKRTWTRSPNRGEAKTNPTLREELSRLYHEDPKGAQLGYEATIGVPPTVIEGEDSYLLKKCRSLNARAACNAPMRLPEREEWRTTLQETYTWKNRVTDMLLRQSIISGLRSGRNPALTDEGVVQNEPILPETGIHVGFPVPVDRGSKNTYKLAYEIIGCINTYRLVIASYMAQSGDRRLPHWEKVVRKMLASIRGFFPYTKGEGDIEADCNRLRQIQSDIYRLGLDMTRDADSVPVNDPFYNDNLSVDLQRIFENIGIENNPGEMLRWVLEQVQDTKRQSHRVQPILMSCALADILKRRCRKEIYNYQTVFDDIAKSNSVIEECMRNALDSVGQLVIAADGHQEGVDRLHMLLKKRIQQVHSKILKSITGTLLEVGHRIIQDYEKEKKMGADSAELYHLLSEHCTERYIDLLKGFIDKYYPESEVTNTERKDVRYQTRNSLIEVGRALFERVKYINNAVN